MSEAALGYPAVRQEFLLRRLHSLTGLFPIGVFLVFHLATNFTILFNHNGSFYQDEVNRIYGLGPMLRPVEFLLIFIPLAFHAGLGVKMWLQGLPNTTHYAYWGNIRYTLQRLTGVFTLGFVLIHLWQMNWVGRYLPEGGLFDPRHAPETVAWVLQTFRTWTTPLYVFGILCACFHFANGLWTGMITWGVTVGPKAQRNAGFVCAAIGLFLAVAGTGALWGFLIFPKPTPPHVARGPVEQTSAGPVSRRTPQVVVFSRN